MKRRTIFATVAALFFGGWERIAGRTLWFLHKNGEAYEVSGVRKVVIIHGMDEGKRIGPFEIAFVVQFHGLFGVKREWLLGDMMGVFNRAPTSVTGWDQFVSASQELLA